MPQRATAAVLGATATGLALAAALSSRFAPVGVWEPDPDAGRAARGAPGVARITADLPATVDGAAVVSCAVRHREIAATFDAAAPHLATGVVVIVAAIGHEDVLAEASRRLPAHASLACVTLFPRLAAPAAPGPRSQGEPRALPAAGISLAPGAHPDAVGVVQAIVEATRAEPFFGDPREIDGLAAAALALPVALGAAAVRATIGAAGGRDLERAGGAALDSLTWPLDQGSIDVDEVHALRDHVARLLQHVASDLTGSSSRVHEAGFDALGVEHAIERRRAWIAALGVPQDASVVPDLPRPRRRRLFF